MMRIYIKIKNKNQNARSVQILFEIFLVILIILSSGAYAAIPAKIDLSYATQVKPGGTLSIWVTISNLNVEYKSVYFDSVVFEDPFVKENISTISKQNILHVNKTLAPVGFLMPEIDKMKQDILSKINESRNLKKSEKTSLDELKIYDNLEKQLKEQIIKGVTTERIDIPVPLDIREGETFSIPLSILISQPGQVSVKAVEKKIFFSVTSNPVPKRAVIIIVDGARADKVYQVAQNNPDGNFSWMIKKGIKVLNATNVFPSLTVVNHPAILTGTYPGKHGITSASVFNKEINYYADYYNLISSFIFDRLNQDLKVRTIYENMPDIMISRVFTEFVKRGAENYEISSGATLNWQACENLKKSIYCNIGDSKVINDYIFPYFRDSRNFDLTVIWLAGNDFQSHAQGPDSTYDVLVNDDVQVGRLKEFYGQAIVDETIFLITSDHGQTEVNESRYITPDQLSNVLKAKGYLKSPLGIYILDDYYIGGNGGGSEEIFIQNGLDLNDNSYNSGSWTASPLWEDIQPAASVFYSQAYVNTVIVRYQNSSGYRVYQENYNSSPYTVSLTDYFNGKTNYIDAVNRINKLDSQTSGDIILLANYSGGYYFDSKGFSGDHGNLNYEDSIIPLIISGPSIRHDVLTSANIVDIAPTVANLLGFSMPDADGDILPVRGENTTLISISNIYHIPSSPSRSDLVDIYANISDTMGISGAEVLWSPDQSFGNAIPMTSIGADVYTTSSGIPAQSRGTTIYYKVCAEDTRASNRCSPVYSYKTSIIIPFTGITGLILLLIILSKLRKH